MNRRRCRGFPTLVIAAVAIAVGFFAAAASLFIMRVARQALWEVFRDEAP